MKETAYFISTLREEEPQDHNVGKRQEKVDMGVILVLLHKECGPEKMDG